MSGEKRKRNDNVVVGQDFEKEEAELENLLFGEDVPGLVIFVMLICSDSTR